VGTPVNAPLAELMLNQFGSPWTSNVKGSLSASEAEGVKENCSPINTEELGVPEMVGALFEGGTGGGAASVTVSSLLLHAPSETITASAVNLIAI